jgi:hypothetical protein
MIECKFAPYSATPLLSVRHSGEVVERDGNWYESFAPDCWLARGKGAQIQFGHNSPVIGWVSVVTGCRDGWWRADGVIDCDDAVVLKRIRVGTPVSVGFDPIHHDDDLHLRLRRHDLAELRHIAVLRRGEIPAFAGAKITAVRELGAKPRSASSGGDWKAVLPAGYESFRDTDLDLQPGDELTLGSAHRGARWDGQRFIVHHSALRAA